MRRSAAILSSRRERRPGDLRRAPLSGSDAPFNGMLQMLALFSPAVSIAGGTDQVQRSIIGERVLGLPAEPRVDKDLPFRELKVGTQRS
jgi:hypothetical protein